MADPRILPPAKPTADAPAATHPPETLKPPEELQREIDIKQARKLKARHEKNRSVWFGLGMFGLVGWSVAIPALAGVAVGYWIDHHYPSRYSWTLMLLVIGTAIGCLNAWSWIQKESQGDDDPPEDTNFPT